MNIGGHTTKLVKMSPNVCFVILRYIYSPEQMISILAVKKGNPGLCWLSECEKMAIGTFFSLTLKVAEKQVTLFFHFLLWS